MMDTPKDSALDWNTYREHFPDRYWKDSAFDDIVRTLLRGESGRCVDIGGGQHGTRALLDGRRAVYLLDPFITQLPKGMAGRARWDEPQAVFEWAVARGSFNYLTPKHFECIKSFLVPGGRLVANTFLSKPSEKWRERAVTNGRGEHGVERVRCLDNTIEHVLEFPSGVLAHEFFYYSRQELMRYFPGARFVHYAPHSHVLMWRKPQDPTDILTHGCFWSCLGAF